MISGLPGSWCTRRGPCLSEGVTALEDICQGLLKAGMEPDMPAAILQKGTTAGQRRIVATVETLPEQVKRQGIETPAIIVVGKVCELAKRFSWYEELPLAGWKVLVTRPKDLISAMSEKLRRKGAEVLELPAIETRPCEDQSRLKRALGELDVYGWVVFTSPTGVKVFFEQMREAGCDIRCLGRAKIAAIGSGTKKALEERGLFVDLMPEIYDGEALGIALSRQVQAGERVLIPRASRGNQSLIESLKTVGAKVDDVPTYDTHYARSKIIQEVDEFENGKIQCAVFTSASTVKGICGRHSWTGLCESESSLHWKADEGGSRCVWHENLYGKAGYHGQSGRFSNTDERRKKRWR